MPFMIHLPLTAEGSWLYLWIGPGRAIHFHINYGYILLLHGDVVHSGETLLHVDHTGKCYPSGYTLGPLIHFDK
jgi:hypothetical protein